MNSGITFLFFILIAKYLPTMSMKLTGYIILKASLVMNLCFLLTTVNN